MKSATQMESAGPRTRTLAVVGHILPPTRSEIARWCSWCDLPLTVDDALKANRGAMKTHTICPDCQGAHFPDAPRAT